MWLPRDVDRTPTPVCNMGHGDVFMTNAGSSYLYVVVRPCGLLGRPNADFQSLRSSDPRVDRRYPILNDIISGVVGPTESYFIVRSVEWIPT